MKTERIICPNCKRSIPKLKSYHYCKEVAIDELFLKKSDEVVLVFDRLLEHLSAYENVEISATKNCIVFVRNKTFVVAKPMTKCLEIKFYSNVPINDEELYKYHLWSSKYESIIRIENESQLRPKHFQYFKNSYLIS
ncbi:hypothetical protein KBJ98_04465 [Flavobacterium sp. F-328]|uniref:DUF5655 domain-containing protein n=1 Tax=Flavobacterium erciyesense TaxID=2825842 RepID=A0ABS5D1P8_9FLAO|nr:DUF5655 domain-containing protein [Flavobacterium erciyesense]MBQ0907950.1 hypothetical protein [Flavobacterium erciyesense]